jgi:hypothetical protein
VLTERRAARSVVQSQLPPLVPNLPEFASKLLRELTDTLDKLFDQATRQREVTEQVFNTITAAVLLALYLETPLQRPSTLTRAYFFSRLDGSVPQASDVNAVQALMRVASDGRDVALVAELTRLRSRLGVRVLVPKSIATNRPATIQPFFAFSPELETLVAEYRAFCRAWQTVTPLLTGLRENAGVKMVPLLQTRRGLLANSSTVMKYANRLVRTAVSHGDTGGGSAVLFKELRQGIRASLLGDARQLDSVAYQRDENGRRELAFAMGHTLDTGEVHYPSASSAVTDAAETVYAKLQRAFVQNAGIADSMPRAWLAIAGRLRQLRGIGLSTPPVAANGLLLPAPSIASSSSSTAAPAGPLSKRPKLDAAPGPAIAAVQPVVMLADPAANNILAQLSPAAFAMQASLALQVAKTAAAVDLYESAPENSFRAMRWRRRKRFPPRPATVVEILGIVLARRGQAGDFRFKVRWQGLQTPSVITVGDVILAGGGALPEALRTWMESHLSNSDNPALLNWWSRTLAANAPVTTN